MTNLGNIQQPPMRKFAWKFNAQAETDQQPPVQNTWYTILDTTEDVRLAFFLVLQDNTETDAKNVDARITVDGVTLTGTPLSLADNTWEFIYHARTSEVLLSSTASLMVLYYESLFGHSVKTEVRLTSAPGTNQRLLARCTFETLEAT